DVAALIEGSEVLPGRAPEEQADRDHVVEPQEVEVRDLQHAAVEQFAAGHHHAVAYPLLPHDLYAGGHGKVVGGLQVFDGACQELRVPGVVVVVDGDELAGAGFDPAVGRCG